MTLPATADRPWLPNYDPGVPPTLFPYPEKGLLDVVGETARANPDLPATVFKGATLRYGELWRLSDAFAAALAPLGVGKGDRVAVLLPNCPQFLVAELGAWKAGAVLVPLNPIYNESELEGPLAEMAPEVILTLTPFYERVKRVQPRTSLRRVIATSIKEHLPPALRLLFTLFREKKEGHRIRLREGDVWLSDLLAAHRTAPPPVERASLDDPALILMSGGTTGTPKGVTASHRGLFISAYQAYRWLRPILTDEKDTLLLPLPLFHAAAAILGQGAFLLARGPLILVPNPRDLDDVVATIRKQRPTFFAGVPTLFNALLEHRDVKAGRVDFGSIKCCFCGAAALMAETKQRFEAVTGGRIAECYSLTEALVALVANPAKGEQKVGSVGMPAPDVDVRIFDAEDGLTARGTGEVGEICLRAPQRMIGYWGRPEETARVLRDHGDGREWLHTGDLGYLDADGYVFIVDRMKDLMKPGGLQVWPREVEEAIATHPAVAEVGVAGVPDAAKGEAVKAWVVVRPTATVTPDEIRAHCKGLLAPFKVPSIVELRRELPKSMVGKVLRRALVAEERARGAQGGQ